MAVIDQHIWWRGVSRIANPTHIWPRITANPREPQNIWKYIGANPSTWADDEENLLKAR